MGKIGIKVESSMECGGSSKRTNRLLSSEKQAGCEKLKDTTTSWSRGGMGFTRSRTRKISGR